jgi:hypothetical protein
MTQNNGIGVSRKRPARAKKGATPSQPKEDPLKVFEEIRQKYGRKMTMKDIEELLSDRYSPARIGKSRSQHPKSGLRTPITVEALFKDWDNKDDDWWNSV